MMNNFITIMCYISKFSMQSFLSLWLKLFVQSVHMMIIYAGKYVQ